MKTLQNNYTTPEQSKRLLELGVPADSADCYLTRFGMDEDWEVKVLNYVKYSEIAISNQEYCLPCWSVGQLIKILSICCSYRHCLPVDYCFVEYIVCIITNEIKLNRIDFSKLEE